MFPNSSRQNKSPGPRPGGRHWNGIPFLALVATVQLNSISSETPANLLCHLSPLPELLHQTLRRGIFVF